MYERKIPLVLDCGLDLLREVTAGKWKISLLYFIGQGLRRPSQLHQRLPDATPRVLNLQLKQLLAHELLRKQTISIRPLNVEYHLTALGESLLPLLTALGHWGDAHQTQLRRVVEQSTATTPLK
jgi:DNA-binding HxlR family transcriptional regulator